jgi:hypothetical protein
MSTLTANEVIQDIMEAFQVSLGPVIQSFTTDFSSKTARLNDTITAHIQGIPATADYDATTGFANGAVEAETLLTDVPVTLDKLKHVPVKIDYLTQLGSKKDLYKPAVAKHGYSLAKQVIDDACALITAANFSHTVTEATANTTFETVEQKVRNAANTQKMAPMGRFGIVSTAFAGAFGVDARVTSRDYYGQLNGASGYRVFKNVCGFENIFEYPDLPTTGNLTAFFGDQRSIVIASRSAMPEHAAEALGIPRVNKLDTFTDPNTGLTFMGIGWEVAGVLDRFFSVAVLYGLKAGKQGGAADAITDRAGLWVKTA